ncbi:MAG: flagellar export chaperone FlgN [Deltaproteobacteria bacterium]|nr:flagellar export chaperone FlgN [Deltaproteobacteria bacterium]
MQNLERAIETTERIRDALTSEIEIARGERILIRNIDVEGLHARAAKRNEFNQRTAILQQSLATELAAVAQEMGSQDVTLDGLTARSPVLGRRISAVLAEVRALASSLSELDSMNRMLGQRALSYVRAHLAVLSPKPAAYDRRGAMGSDARTSTTVVRVL